jgi:uncharacterized protein (TIGR00369 family)
MSEDVPPTRHPLLQSIREAEHARCFFCGQERADGMKLEFHAVGEGSVTARFESGAPYEGYPGLMHGGVIAAILDSAMTNCLFSLGIVAVTAEMRVRYVVPVKLALPLEAAAEVVRLRDPLCDVRARIAQGRIVVARAEATFMRKDRMHRRRSRPLETRGIEP